MLWLERQVVATLVSPTTDDRRRSEVEDYVDGCLRSMPEYLRAGVAAESLFFSAWPLLVRGFGRLDRRSLEKRIQGWEASRIDPIRQYVRLLQSLVLFAENELASGSTP